MKISKGKALKGHLAEVPSVCSIKCQGKLLSREMSCLSLRVGLCSERQGCVVEELPRAALEGEERASRSGVNSVFLCHWAARL